MPMEHCHPNDSISTSSRAIGKSQVQKRESAKLVRHCRGWVAIAVAQLTNTMTEDHDKMVRTMERELSVITRDCIVTVDRLP